MRALFVHAAPRWSGVARTIAAAARGLTARGWDAAIACPDHGTVGEHLTERGVTTVPLDLDGNFIAVGRRISEVIARRFVEVVFVHDEVEQAAATAAVRLAGRGAVIRRYQSGIAPRRGLRGRLLARQAPTGYLYELGEEDAPPPSRRSLATIPMRLGVDPGEYDTVRPAPRPTLGAGVSSRLIVCIHGPGRRGSASTLLRTMKLLAPRNPDLRVAFIGHGSDDEDLRMHAAALGLTRVVAFLGVRDDERAVIRAADVAWIVAEQDTAAWGFLDCMAMQIPMLAERTPQAQRYVADGIAGLLLPEGESEATAATVTAFLAQEDRRAAMGAAGRARAAREFTGDAMIDAFEQAAAAARDRSAWTA